MGENQSTIKTISIEAGKVVAIAVVVIAIFSFISVPNAELKSDILLIKQDIVSIKTNHLQHIYTQLEKQEAWNERTDARLDSIDISLAKIITLLEK